MPHQVGYCCINTTLQKSDITYSRGMIKKTFDQRGMDYASKLALANSRDFIKVLQWNADNDIKVFRMGSSIFPWASQYIPHQLLPDMSEIVANLEMAGEIAKRTGQRITAHPDHFVKLGSIKPDVINNSMFELELQAMIFDTMGLPKTPYAAINIHVGMNFDENTAARWVKNASQLSLSAASRLVVENDDKASGFSVVQLFAHIFSEIGTPITFDYFHHQFHPDDLSTQDAFELAYSTWPDGITPLFHVSESRNVELASDVGNPRAHSDYINNIIDDFGYDVDIDLEAKAKEFALFKYRELL
jgi:UV DNA damage endonuclease